MKSRTAETVLNECYLETRAKLLEVAAILDRIDRAADRTSDTADGGSEMSDAAVMRHDQLTRAIRLLLSDSPRRAQEIQQLFSRGYDPNWRTVFGLQPEPSPASSPEKQSPEKQLPEKQSPEKQLPEKQSPGKRSRETATPKTAATQG